MFFIYYDRGEGMNFSDSFFNKIEKKTNVGKETILDLAKKLQQSDMKSEGTLREIIHELGQMTGKTVSKEKEDKIIEHRRQLRKRFLESLKIGDIKLIESARQSMLNYEIGLKLEQQENEREV